MLKLLKNDKGFTLMEAIISVAVLAILSGFILKMFIVSDNVNVRAKAMDNCNNIAVTTMETVKNSNIDKNLSKLDFFENCIIIEDGEEVVLYKGYDENFEDFSRSSGFDDINNIPPEVQYISKTTIIYGEENSSDIPLSANSVDGVSEAIATGRLDHIIVEVADYTDKNHPETMVTIDTNKYYPTLS